MLERAVFGSWVPELNPVTDLCVSKVFPPRKARGLGWIIIIIRNTSVSDHHIGNLSCPKGPISSFRIKLLIASPLFKATNGSFR